MGQDIKIITLLASRVEESWVEEDLMNLNMDGWTLHSVTPCQIPVDDQWNKKSSGATPGTSLASALALTFTRKNAEPSRRLPEGIMR